MKILEYPQTQEPVLVDQVLFIPSRTENHGIAWPHSFSEVSIELGSGNGEWIINRATTHPEQIWIAVEKKFKRVQKIYKKGQHLPNLWIVCGDAFNFLEYYLDKGSASNIYFNFPDPWPKRAHAHHRMVQLKMVSLLKNILNKNGKCTLTTDDYPTTEVAEQLFDLWEKQDKKEYDRSLLESWGSSYFARFWLERNKTIYQSVFGVNHD